MDYQPINELVEKYFQGETNLEEEALLKDYFRKAEIDPDLEQYRPLFAYLRSAGAEQPAPDLEKRILQKITASGTSGIRRLWPTIARMAAAVLIAVAAWWYFKPAPPQQTAAIDWSKYEPKTVAEAYEITRATLMMTSQELNKTARRAAQEVSKVQEAGRVFK